MPNKDAGRRGSREADRLRSASCKIVDSRVRKSYTAAFVIHIKQSIRFAATAFKPAEQSVGRNGPIIGSSREVQFGEV